MRWRMPTQTAPPGAMPTVSTMRSTRTRGASAARAAGGPPPPGRGGARGGRPRDQGEEETEGEEAPAAERDGADHEGSHPGAPLSHTRQGDGVAPGGPGGGGQ